MIYLTKPIMINNLMLNNRLIMPPLATSKSEDDGSVSAGLLNYYDEKSEDGYISMIIIEHSFVEPAGKASERQLSVAEDKMIDGLSKLAKTIQQNGTKAVMQISHAGSATERKITGCVPVGPSAITNPRKGVKPRELTVAEIEGIVQSFKDAAVRVKNAGFDGVEIHSAHGYLLNQFYSPLSNKRSDKYGWNLLGRIQIHLEIIREVRKAVGTDFPILLRLGASDFMEGGTTIENSKIAAVEFEKAGVDAIDISGGFCGYILNDKAQGYFSDLSEEIKKVVSIPVILTGGIIEGDFAEKLLSEAKADLIGVGRASAKDSGWAKRTLSLYQNSIKYIENTNAGGTIHEKNLLDGFGKEVMGEIRNFHRSFPDYKVTPLHCLGNLSRTLGIERIWVKDESFRFGLNAFKVLGGSYAIGKYLAQQLNMNISELSFERLKSDEIRNKLGDLTFVTATDGNHGRGVAWAANQLGQKSVVFLPKGTAEARLLNIKREGADASITDLNYDDTVRLAKEYSKNHNGIIIQDSVREDYEKIPTWIMQGYMTIIDEVVEQITEAGERLPTHVFLQAGVGAFASGITAYLAASFNDNMPIITVVEPDEADCYYQSVKRGDGNPHTISGFMPTIMAGLACGEPCALSWNILSNYADFFVSCSDSIAAEGMKILGNPLPEDPRVVSGESGAVGLGLLKTILSEMEYTEIKDSLKIDQNSRVLLISTEGDTDPINYKKIVESENY